MTPSAKRTVGFAVGIAAVLVVALLLRSRDDDKRPGAGTPAESAVASSPSSDPASRPPVVGTAEPSAARPASSGERPASAPNGSGQAVDLGLAMLEAKKVQAARAALAAGNPKLALQEIAEYEKIPEATALRQEATLIKIEALSKVGRRTDALALAMSARDDPGYADYKDRIESVVRDAGL